MCRLHKEKDHTQSGVVFFFVDEQRMAGATALAVQTSYERLRLSSPRHLYPYQK